MKATEDKNGRTAPAMQIEGDGATFRVLSTSGKTYTVRYCGSGDGDPEYVALWECDCPAGQHGKPCKHIHAVAAWCDEQYS